MKVVYHASNILEAHIVAGLLCANDIAAQVGGHYLQGAVGDLAAMGFATVCVDDSAVSAAQLLVQEYEQAG